MSELSDIVKRLVGDGKGIFAADASQKSMDNRLTSIGVTGNEEVRRNYRQMLLTTKGLGQYIGGVILHDETIRQATNEGKPFVQVVSEEGIVPGIKVDRGTVDIPKFNGEKIAEGLDGLQKRLAEYYQMGARFTKWRGVIKIGEGIPSELCMEANADVLARYGAFSQEAGMVPIVEPEVVMEGAHGIEACVKATEETGKHLIKKLADYKIDLSGAIYKINMILPGRESTETPNDDEIAKTTIETLKRFIPAQMGAVVFLSGGQDEIVATKRLDAINKSEIEKPWRMTFSFERAFESPAMKVWMGKPENVEAAQKALLNRARLNSLASVGQYPGEEV